MSQSPESFTPATETHQPHPLWPQNLPNPYTPVENPPWESWLEPRGEQNSPENHLGFWFFCIGMMLWEIQLGLHPASDIGNYPPDKAYINDALAWLAAFQPPRPPRLRGRRREAWDRRQQGVECLLSMLNAGWQALPCHERECAMRLVLPAEAAEA